MWYPIARIKRDKNEKGEPTGEHKYVLINALTNEEKIMTNAEVKRSTEDIRGFSSNGLKEFYKRLPYIGVEQDDGIEYYTLIKKIFYLDKTSYVLVSRDKKHHMLSRYQLIEKLEQGHIVAGAKLTDGGILKISGDVEEKLYRNM